MALGAPESATTMTSDGKSFYELLQVSRDASPVVIDASFRALMKIHHPDRGGDHSRTKDLLKARRVLLDAKLRQDYDRMLRELEWRQHQPPTPPPSAQPIPPARTRLGDLREPEAGAEAHEQFKRQVGQALEILGPFVLVVILLGLALLALSGVLLG